MGKVVGPGVLEKILVGVKVGSCFEEGDVDSLGGKDMGSGAAAGAGADDDVVVGVGLRADLCHVTIGSQGRD